jgi:HK97 family phage prohead protease
MTEFIAREAFNPGIAGVGLYRSSALPAQAVDGLARTLRFVFSDNSIDRYGDSIDPNGWDLNDYTNNNVALWAHDSSMPPIGRAHNVGPSGNALLGDIEFMDADLSQFADTIFRMYKAGYLSAVSVGFLPLEWKASKDAKRTGGIDFKRQSLLEISCCPIPALPSAIIQARSFGIDTKPLYDWAGKALDEGGFVMLPRGELEQLRKDAKMPSAKPEGSAVENDGHTAPPEVVVAGKTGLVLGDKRFVLETGDKCLPKSAADIIRQEWERCVKDGTLLILDNGFRLREIDLSPAARAPKIAKKDLYLVGWLAMLLEELGWIEDSSEWEEEFEGDDSKVPQMLADAMSALGQALIAMTIEEVGELLGQDFSAPPAAEDDSDIVMMSAKDAKLEILRLMRKADDGAISALAATFRHHIAGRRVSFKVEGKGAGVIQRAGRIISSENEKCLRDAHGLMSQACDMVMGVVGQVDPDEPNEDPAPESADPGPSPAMSPDDIEKRAARERQVRQLKAQAVKAEITN